MNRLTSTGPTTIGPRIDRAVVGALRGQDLSGFEIWHWLGSGGGVAGLLAEADLYPTLYRLEAAGVIAAEWYEGERTRRRYRLTGKALALSEEHGWPPVALRRAPDDSGEPGSSGTPSEPVLTRRSHSPDPDSGAWFVPPKAEPATNDPSSAPASVGPAGPQVAPGRASSMPASNDAAQPGRALIARYVDDLIATLDMPGTYLSEIHEEIADHLIDAAEAIGHGGMDPESATAEALDRLGPAQTLARKIELAQHTPDRRNRGIRSGVLELVGEMVVWLAISAIAIVVAPGIGDVVVAWGRVADLHLALIGSAGWAANQVAMGICIGAFAAGRISLGYLARISRHRDGAVRMKWAAGGAAALLAVVLVLPCYGDPLVVATLLAAPLAFIAGTFRPKHLNEKSYSIPWLIAASVFMLAVILLPAVRLFAYDPNGTPGTPLAPGNAVSYVVFDQQPDGTYEYTTSGAAATGVTFELWPASTDGLYVAVDRSATRPAIVATGAVDLARLPPSGQWWVVAVQKSADGKRTAVAIAIQSGVAPAPGTVLGWLISHL